MEKMQKKTNDHTGGRKNEGNKIMMENVRSGKKPSIFNVSSPLEGSLIKWNL